MNFKNFISELKRRNVFRVATAYAIAGWLIIQVVDTVSPQLGFPDWIPALFTIIVFCGLPIALIIAWAFELTPEGLKRYVELKKEESITHSTGKKINQVIIGALSLAVVFLIVERVFFAPSSILAGQTAEVENASIAVLPFVNMSGDQENEYFSDGLSEELLNVLAKVEGMKVAGRTSSFQYKGQNPDFQEVGQKLGVKHILEGSVRKSGNRVRITAQLINSEDGYHIWSETYDRELNDIFAIQDEISRAVLNELRIRLLPEEERRMETMITTDVEAYNIYLKATQLEATRMAEDLELAIQQYQEAIRLDPSFAKAYARMAIAYQLLANYGNLADEDRRRLVRDNVDQALFLSDEIPEAYAALGLMFDDNGEVDKSIEAYKKALELNPNYGIAYSWLGNAYSGLNDDKNAIENYNKAYQIDPLNSVVHNNYARGLLFQDRYEEALEIYEARVKLEPKFLFSYYRVAEINYWYIGNMEAAFRSLLMAKQINEDAQNTLVWLAGFGASSGFTAFARETQQELVSLYPDNNFSHFVKIWIYQFERDYPAALDAIQNQYMPTASDEVFDAGFLMPLYDAAEAEGKMEVFDEVMEKYHPSFIDGEFEINPSNQVFARAWLKRLKAKGHTKRIEAFEEAFCDYADREQQRWEANPHYQDFLYPRLMCADLQGNQEEFLEWWEHYDSTISPLAIYFDLIHNKPEWDFVTQELPEVEATKQRVKSHYEDQRARTKEVLVEFGEWRDEWEAKQ